MQKPWESQAVELGGQLAAIDDYKARYSGVPWDGHQNVTRIEERTIYRRTQVINMGVTIFSQLLANRPRQ